MQRFEIRAQGGGSELIIYGDIGADLFAEESNDAKTVVSKIRDLAGDLTVRINSFGGSVSDGIAIHNALKAYAGPVTVAIDGVAYSVASLIAMAADPGQLKIAENALMMVHGPMGRPGLSNAGDLRDLAQVLDKHAEAMLASYAKRVDADLARGWLTDREDHYFTAAEAIEVGLADSLDEAADTTPIAACLKADARSFLVPAAARRDTAVEAFMPNDDNTGVPTSTPQGDDIVAGHNQVIEAAGEAALARDKKRRAAVRAVYDGFDRGDALSPITAQAAKDIEDTNCDELQASRNLQAILRTMSSQPVVEARQYGVEPAHDAPPNVSQHLGGAMQISADVRDRRAAGLQRALEIKAGLVTDYREIEKERASEFLAMSLTDVMAQEMRAAGYSVGGMREDIARAYVRALPVIAAGPSHGSDHLPQILGNIANLATMQGWESAEETWATWTQAGTLTNYQTATRANLALLDKLNLMQENEQWSYGDMADVKQRITAYFHGLKYGVSVQALANDQLGELQRAMSGWGEAASATVGDAVHAVLFAAGTGGFGQTMDEDSQILFHADHGNYVESGSGAAPSTPTLNAARSAMMIQTDQNSRTVAIRPRYLLHGPSLWSTVDEVLNSTELTNITVDGTTDVTTMTGRTNSVQRMNLVPVEEYRMIASAPAATAWALLAARRTVEVAGVGGPVRPRADQAMISDTPGITYELSMPFGVAALDYRGMYLNYGA